MKQIFTILFLLTFSLSALSFSEAVSTQELEEPIQETVTEANNFDEAMTEDDEQSFEKNEEDLSHEREAQKKAEAETIFLRLYAKDLETLKDSLLKSDYLLSMDLLNRLSEKVKMRQKEELSHFYPKQLHGYKSQTDSQQSMGQDFNEPNYGVLFTRKYRNSKGSSLEFNIVYSDDSIKDFLEIVENPNLVQGMQNTSIVKVQAYKALETVSDDSMYFEQNIVLNGDLMMTIVGIGVSDADIIKDFLNEINLSNLESYFKK